MASTAAADADADAATATKEAIENLWEEVRELSLGSTTTQIDHLPSPPTPLQFLRDYISPNKPCLIYNSISHWPALSLWPSTSYLQETLKSSPVSLHLTPTGRADSLIPHPHSNRSSSPLVFASAHVEKVPFSTALKRVSESSTCTEKGAKRCVGYLQEQNDCFRNEYGDLSQDCDDHIPWASEALGCLPEAVNLWIGNQLSVTSFHKDHYENLYAVITGEKRFLLLPPTDVHRMYIRDYPAAQYRYSEDTEDFELEIEDPVRYVPWCSVDPYPSFEGINRQMAEFPLYYNGPKPFEVTVKAGQVLYLPSMWFHHVSQCPDSRGLTIAVNYWYDMRFDIKYAYFNFLQSINYISDSAFWGGHVDSHSKVSASKGEDELEMIEFVPNGDATGQGVSDYDD
ncbi:lysine-specific demethylase JMJ32 [Coffea arabica]|uniref:JmjC domain-containing protein 7-like n=1 Tax=Coffea arabica TaxID=13443 RepID=A0A6P6U1X3_COFAR|nr:jmjC domain-containing protein 7-like [Coffea arabica]XP_027084091.1 jmjC domain-containing protein 7-like [Coffea arabica]